MTIFTRAIWVRLVLAAAFAIPILFPAKSSNGIELAQATPRNRPGGSGYLGDLYSDRENGFSIYPPAGWLLDNKDRRFAVKFTDWKYQAFILIDTIKTDSEISIDKEFIKFIREKNNDVKEQIPSFTVSMNRQTTLNRSKAYRTEAAFKAGPNQVLMNIYYVPSKTKIYMITTVCPEATVRNWEPLFNASLATLVIMD